MPSETYIKSGGVWREVKALYIKSGGLWRTVQNAWIKSGGVWRLVYQANQIISGNHTSAVLTVVTNPRVDFLPDGTVTKRDTSGNTVSSGNWHPTSAGIGASYFIRFYNGAGTGTWNGSTLDIWHQLDVGKFASIVGVSAGQIRQYTLNWQISNAAGGTILGSGAVNLDHDRT